MSTLLALAVTVLAMIVTVPIASIAQSDLSLGLLVEPVDSAPPGTVGKVTVYITNLGPEAIQNAIVVIVVGVPVSFSQIAESCLLFRGVIDPLQGSPSDFYEFVFPNLQPGETSSCQAGFSVGTQLKGQVRLTWETVRLPSQPLDPNPANNSATMVFGLPLPTAVPAMRPGAVVFLISLMVGVAAWRLKSIYLKKP